MISSFLGGLFGPKLIREVTEIEAQQYRNACRDAFELRSENDTVRVTKIKGVWVGSHG